MIGVKQKENWYPNYAPRIILDSKISILDLFYYDKGTYRYEKAKDAYNRNTRSIRFN